MVIPLLVLAVSLAAPAGAPDAADRWPSFRGPEASGLSPARNVPTSWDVPKGASVLWKTPIPGLAHSGPIVWGDRVFVTTAVRTGGERELKVGLYGDIGPVNDAAEHSWEVLALDRATGTVLWKTEVRRGVPKVKRHPKSSHASATPATDGRRIVAFFGSEGLHALDLAGKPLWSADLGLLVSAFYVAPDAQWGFASSPVLHDGKVVVQCDVLEKSFLAAFDAETGKEVWRTSRDDVPTWSTPTIGLRDGRPEVLANGYRHMGGYDLATGKEIWRLRGGGDIPVPAPIVAGDLAIFTSAHGGGAPIFAVRAGAEGDITPPAGSTSSAGVAWSRPRGGNYLPTPIACGDLLFLGGDAGVLSCLKLRTGEEVYRKRLEGAFAASPVSAAGKIYLTNEEGAVHVVKASAEFEEIAVNQLGETCLASPAIAEGAIFFRTRGHLVAVGERASTAPGAGVEGPKSGVPAPAGEDREGRPARRPAATVRIVPAESPAVAARRAGEILAARIGERSGARVMAEGSADLTVRLRIEPGAAREGFRIEDEADGGIRVTGADARGLLYGVGKLLHTASFDERGFTPGGWRGTSAPGKPVRGIYFATHFHNYYQVAPLEDVRRYVEDLSLWGVNAFLVWFGMEEFEGIKDPKAQAMISRLRSLLGIVKELGLDASLGCIGNDGYKNGPADLHADDSTVGHAGYHTRMGPRIYNLGNELCPSKPGVPEMQLGFCREKFEAFRDVGLDYWVLTPYDNGGCTCAKCAPWGTNGYLRMAELLARAYREAFPGGKVVLGTWYFDRWADGEWAGLAARFAEKKPDWVDYLLADNFEDYPKYPLEHGVPGGFPLLNFPEISMWGQDPWGGYGANPYPGRLQERWNLTREKLSGGFPYSEGIYEDLNKVICARLYWDPDRPAKEAVREYAAYEFSPEAVDDVASAVEIFEANHQRDRIGERSAEACALLERAEGKMTAKAKRSWRWRLLRIRASLDEELRRNRSGQGRPDVFKGAYDELLAISRAADAWPMLRPVLIPAVEKKP